MSRNNHLVIIIVFIFLHTSCKSNYKNINYYIPLNYKGSIALVFNVDSSDNHAVISGDTISYYIKNNPCFYTLRHDKHKEGWYKVKYFYYSTDTLIELISTGNSRQVVSRGTISITKKEKIVFESIYISDSIREINSLYNEIKKYPDICWDK
jgi:hypothetical protein